MIRDADVGVLDRLIALPPAVPLLRDSAAIGGLCFGWCNLLVDGWRRDADADRPDAAAAAEAAAADPVASAVLLAPNRAPFLAAPLAADAEASPVPEEERTPTMLTTNGDPEM